MLAYIENGSPSSAQKVSARLTLLLLVLLLRNHTALKQVAVCLLNITISWHFERLQYRYHQRKVRRKTK